MKRPNLSKAAGLLLNTESLTENALTLGESFASGYENGSPSTIAFLRRGRYLEDCEIVISWVFVGIIAVLVRGVVDHSLCDGIGEEMEPSCQAPLAPSFSKTKPTPRAMSLTSTATVTKTIR